MIAQWLIFGFGDTTFCIPRPKARDETPCRGDGATRFLAGICVGSQASFNQELEYPHETPGAFCGRQATLKRRKGF